MIDNEIINKLNKAADEITKTVGTSHVSILADDFFAIYNLINRLKAENERFHKLQKPTETSGFIVEDNRIVFYTNILNGYRHEYVTINEIARELNGLLNAAYKNDEVLSHYKGKLQTAKSEAVKEFAELVKMEFYKEFDELIPSIMADRIDDLVKEMTEQSVNYGQVKRRGMDEFICR